MKDLYLVVDAVHARWFSLIDQKLVEQRSMINPGRRTRSRDAFSESKPGRRDHAGTRAKGLDDHRMEHYRELEKRFAHEIRVAAEAEVATHAAKRIVIVSDARMMGHLRPALAGLGVEMLEVEKDLAGWPAHKIQDALVAEELAVGPKRGRLPRS